MSRFAEDLTEGEEVREVKLKGEIERRRDRPRSVLDSSGRKLLELGTLRSRVRPRNPSWSGGGTTVILISRNESFGGAIRKLDGSFRAQQVAMAKLNHGMLGRK